MTKVLLYYSFITTVGVGIGMYMSSFVLKNRFRLKLDSLKKEVKKKEQCLVNIESEYGDKKERLDAIIMDSIQCKSKLLETSNDVRRKADELYRVEEKLANIKRRVFNMEKIEIKNRELKAEVTRLKGELNRLGDNSKLLEEIERLKGVIESRDREIETLKKSSEFDDANFLKMSKDQFKQIEKMLKEYKAKIDMMSMSMNNGVKIDAVSRNSYIPAGGNLRFYS